MIFRTLFDAESAVRHLLEGNPPQSPEHLGRAMTHLTSQISAESLVRLALDDEEALAAIARRSYSHANGFDKFVLLSSRQPEFELRLHVWWPGEGEEALRKPQLRIHNHRWDYASHLVCGSLHFFGYELTEKDDGREMHEHAYLPLREKDQVELKFLGMARLRCIMDAEMPRETTYSLSHRVLHHVETSRRGVSATLVLRGAAHTTETRVYLDRPAGRSGPVPLHHFDSSQASTRLRRLRSHFDGG